MLTELVKRILGDRPHQVIPIDRKDRNGVTSFQEALGRLATAGVAVDFSVLFRENAPPGEKPAKRPAVSIEVTGTG